MITSRNESHLISFRANSRLHEIIKLSAVDGESPSKTVQRLIRDWGDGKELPGDTVELPPTDTVNTLLTTVNNLTEQVAAMDERLGKLRA